MTELTQSEINAAFDDWTTLNATVMSLSDEGQLRQLLDWELSRPDPRPVYATRILSRIHKVRALEERRDLRRRLMQGEDDA